MSMGLAIAQNTTIKGIVIDESNEAVIGASVVVKGTTTGTVTDIDGNFTLSVPSTAKTIVIRYIGMADQESPISNNMVVRLKASSQDLDEVIVIAYGSAKKTGYTGAGNNVKGKDIERVPVSSFEQALQGAAPGVTVTSSTGQPGASQSIRIRGVGSMNASNAPLYVIDGVPMLTSTNTTDPGNFSLSGVSGNAGSLGISNQINNSDIESITVLKDAAAASMYGSRGANGVILITTKKGKEGKSQFKFNGSWGVNDWAVKNRSIISGDDMRYLFAESYRNALSDAYGDRYTDADYWESAWEKVNKDTPIPANGYSDWEKELFDDYGFIQNYELVASGGNNKTKYYASLGYRDENGKTAYSWLKQYSARVNLTHEEGNLKFGANLAITKIDQRAASEGTSYSNPYYATRTYLFPTTPIYNDDGTYYTGSLLRGYANLVKDAGLDYSGNDMFSSSNNAWAEYKIIKGLIFKQTLSYDYLVNYATTNWPSNSNNGAVSQGTTIKLVPTYQKVYSSSLLTYDNTFAEKHNVNALLGWDVDKRLYNIVQAVGKGFGSPDLKELASAATPTTAFSNHTDDRILSLISRINYDYDNKYYLTGTYRRDGSTRLGKNTRWGNFWSASGAWRISQESFLIDSEIIDNLKIRASYGTSGTLPVNLYSHLSTYSFNADYVGSPGSYPSRLPNPDLTWEKNHVFDIGLELRLFDALSFEFDYYNRNTKDLLMDVPVSRTTGFSTTLKNAAEMNNKGVEFDISYDIFKDSEFKWTTGLALSYNKNKITKLYEGQTEIINTEYTNLINRVGEAYNSLYVREYAGVNSATGAEQWYTNKTLADGSIEREITEDPTKANRVIVGKVSPDWTGGWRNNFSWKGFELTAMFSFVTGGDFFDSGWTSVSNGMYDFTYLPAKSQLDRWQNPGDDTDVGRRVYNYRYGNYNSSKWVHPYDHIRLKNLTFAYSISSKLAKTMKISSLRIYATGNNLLTWSKTDDFDPEVPANGQVGYNSPPLKSMVLGIELGF